MATIVLTCCGTLDDHRPFVGLASLLQANGHQPRLVVNPAMLPFATDSGTDAVSNGTERLDVDRSTRAAAFWTRFQQRPEDLVCSAFASALYLAALPHLLAACRDADLIIAAPQMYPIALAIAERLDIRCACLALSPLPLEPASRTVASKLLAERQDLFTPLFRALALPSPFATEVERFWPPQYGLLAVSEHFHPLPAALRDRIVPVGFLQFHDPAISDWQPEPALERFIQAHGAPLVLSCASLPVDYGARVVEVHARAAAILGRTLIIQRDGAALEIDTLPAEFDRSRIRLVDWVPHDWLYARAAAVIHDGDIRTLACALRQGRPMLIEPYGNDQFSNARRAVELGVATAMHPQLITAEGVANVLAHKVLGDDVQRNAAALGKLIGSEQPVAATLAAIERLLHATAEPAA